MIDLEEIKRHRALWTPDDSTSLPTICAHVDALVAEVERLREHRKSCTENLLKGCAMSQGFAPSRAERETRRFVQVQRLRHATGATRTECEHALTECRGDTDAAIEWLRRQVRQ